MSNLCCFICLHILIDRFVMVWAGFMLFLLFMLLRTGLINIMTLICLIYLVLLFLVSWYGRWKSRGFLFYGGFLFIKAVYLCIYMWVCVYVLTASFKHVCLAAIDVLRFAFGAFTWTAIECTTPKMFLVLIVTFRSFLAVFPDKCINPQFHH